MCYGWYVARMRWGTGCRYQVQYKGTGERVWVAEERVRGLTTAWKDESPVAAGAEAGELNLVDGMVKDGYANFLVPLLKVIRVPSLIGYTHPTERTFLLIFWPIKDAANFKDYVDDTFNM